VIEWNTHDEYCNMFLTLGNCNSRTGTAAREYMLRYLERCYPHTNVFRRLEQRPGQTRSETPETQTNPDRSRAVPTPANEDTRTAAVERQPQRSPHDTTRELGAIPI
jgi:hypothetical protein